MALPWQRGIFKPFKDEGSTKKFFDEQAPQSGIYGLPGEPTYLPTATKEEREAIDQAVWQQMQDGPVVFASRRSTSASVNAVP